MFKCFPAMCFVFISKCASLSYHLVNLALYVLFDLFYLNRCSSAWWSVSNSIGFPYMYKRKCSSPHTTASNSSSFIAYFSRHPIRICSRIQSGLNFRLSVFAKVLLPFPSYLRLSLGCSQNLSCNVQCLVVVLLGFSGCWTPPCVLVSNSIRFVF